MRSKRTLTNTTQETIPSNSTVTSLGQDGANISSSHIVQIEQGEPSSKKAKPTAERSWVWAHFTKCTVKVENEIIKDGKKEKVEEMVLKAKCNYCDKLFACDTAEGGTSSIGKHIKKSCKKYEEAQVLKLKLFKIKRERES